MFMNVVDNHAPLKRKRLRNKKSPWMNANLKQLFLRQKIQLTGKNSKMREICAIIKLDKQKPIITINILKQFQEI